MKYLLAITLLITASCSALSSPAKTALDLIAPVAAEALTNLIRQQYGTDPDEATAVCVPLGDLSPDDDYVYAICRAKPVE